MGWFIHKVMVGFWSTFYKVFNKFFFTDFGRNVRIEGWIHIPQRGGQISIADDVRICKDVELSVTSSARLCLHKGSMIGKGTLLSAHNSITVGRNSMIAEYVCIHDNNHIFQAKDIEISGQGFESSELIIGADCWIGAHCVLTMGSYLEHGVVVGANSLVNKRINKFHVVVGSPAKTIRERL